MQNYKPETTKCKFKQAKIIMVQSIWGTYHGEKDQLKSAHTCVKTDGGSSFISEKKIVSPF